MSERPHGWTTPIYQLLFDTLTDYRSPQGVLAVPKLAKAMKMTHQGVYVWLRGNRLTPDGARKLIKVSGGKLTAEMLLPFLLNA